MFAVQHDTSPNGHAIDNQSFLFETSDELLNGELLTPDSVPKFDLKDPKPAQSPFGEFDALDIYEQYHESGPSSIHLGDGNDALEASGGDMSAKDVAKGALSIANGWHGTASGQHGTNTPASNSIDESHNGANTTANHQDISVDTRLSPIQKQLLQDSEHVDHGTRQGGPSSQNVSNLNKVKREHSPGFSLSQEQSTPVNRSEYGQSAENSHQASFSPASKMNATFRARTMIPMSLSWFEFARQCILAAYSSRLNPFALHPGEYKLLREYINQPQVTIYLNLRNAILRLWTRNPLVAVTKQDAAGCARDSRFFDLSQVAYEWLCRHGYINFGCVEPLNSTGSVPRIKVKGAKRRTIVVIGAGMSGLGCARQLQSLISQAAETWIKNGEKPPKVIVLEGRGRIGGRVYSHPLKRQGNLPDGLRSTAEMGAQIVTGFEHGNPLNAIIRGQLGLRYHALKDNSILYDSDGKVVDKRRDVMAEELYNDVLERVSVYRHKPAPHQTIEGDRSLMEIGKEPSDDSGEIISALEDAGHAVAVSRTQISGRTVPEHAPVSIEKLSGRAYQLGGLSSKVPAAKAAQSMGYWLRMDITPNDSVDIEPEPYESKHPTLGQTMDGCITEYLRLLQIVPQDMRLLNWHHANLEYANAANVNLLSLAGWDQDIGNEFEGEHTEVIGGYTQVPRGLWQCPTPLDVRFKRTVKAIRYIGEPTECGRSAVVQCDNGEIFEADRVVITTPLGVLKSGTVKFEPALPDWKSGAIERLGFGLLNKIVLVYEKAFWEEHRDMFGVLNDATNPYSLDPKHYSSTRGKFYLFWNCTKTSGRPMLIGLMVGDAAFEAEKVKDSVLVEEVTGRFRKMFAPKTIPPPSEVIVTRWKKDPLARGTYSYVGPESQPGDYDAMAQPVGPLHFAGEATCGTHPATVHGAYLSGLRAASEVFASLAGPISIPTPLVPPKPKQEPHPPSAGVKRKYYDIVLEPIHKPPPALCDFKRADEEYEASVIGAILALLGERPIKPLKGGVNPFLLYQKDHWYSTKEECDGARRAAAKDPGAKSSRNEIRIALGAKWRSAGAEEKRPYLEQAQGARDLGNASIAEYNAKAAVWDRDAARIRREFVEAHPLPDGRHRLFIGKTAIEAGAGRSRRKVDGEAEEGK